MCIVTIATFLAKPMYEANSQVLVKIGRENFYVPTTAKTGPVINDNRDEQINAEIEILKSLSLAEKVMDSLGPAVVYKNISDMGSLSPKRFFFRAHTQRPQVERAALIFQKALKVEKVKKANMIKVSFRHEEPQMAALVANTLVSSYLDRHLQVHQTPQSSKFFHEQSKMSEHKLREAESKLQNFKKRHNISSLAEERSILLKQAADLHAALNQTLSQEVETENRIRELRLQLGATTKTIPQGEEIDHNPFLISSLEARLVDLELKEKELTNKYNEESRSVRNVREEIKMVRQKLSKQETKRYGKSRYGLNPTYQRLQDELLRNEAELKALRGKKETQTSQLAQYLIKLKQLNMIEVEFRELQQESEVNRQNYRLYLTKFEEFRISDAMDTEKIANISLIEPARPPLKPVSPKVMLNIVLGVFLGGFGGLGLAFFLEYFDDSLESPEDVKEVLGLPILASIPELKKYSERRSL